MKKSLVVPLLAALLCASHFAFGQFPPPVPMNTPDASAAPSAPPPPGLRGLLSLTPEEQQTLRTAGGKAAAEPEVRAAADKQFQALKAAGDAIVAKNPSFGPIFGKFEASSAPGATHVRFTPEELQQLREAHDLIAGTPQADAWRDAALAYRATITRAMIAQDPSVAAIIKKINGSSAPHFSPAASPAPSVTGSAQ